jgi:hypothetical protein
MTQLPTLGQQVKETKPVKPPFKPKSVTTSVDVPFLEEVFDGYFSHRVDITLTSPQRETLKAILFGLQNRFAKLENGKDVSNAGDALKWILESVSRKTDSPK